MSYVLKKTRRVTLSDVAKEAGLSPATVSTVLNTPEENCPIAPKTRELVLSAAKRLGYRASWRARALAKQQTRTIGLLYAGESPFTTGFNQALLDALAVRLCDHGYHQLFIPILDEGADYQDIITSDRIDGCLVLAPMPQNLEPVMMANLPTVLVNLASSLPLSQVLPDDHAGAAAITHHLISLGHQRIGFVMTQAAVPHISVERRTAAFMEAMRAAGLAQYAHVIPEDAAQQVIQDWPQSRDRMTALIAYEHHLAARLLQSAWMRKISVPDELSIASFNDVEFLQYTTPPMTTVALPAKEMAQRAADQLIKQINDPQETPRTILLPETLIVRGSTGAPLVGGVRGHS